MHVVVNEQTVQMPKGALLPALLKKLGLGAQRVAVVVNGDVVPRERHDAYVLKENDRVDLLTLSGGG